MPKVFSLLFACLMLAVSHTAAEEPAKRELRLNQIQMVGTHNSYHLRPPAAMLKAAMSIRKDAKEWDYSRQTIDQQLDQGVRSFELDMHISNKGWQVMHVPTFDPGTTVPMFADALRAIRDWSARHPRHVPISLLLELKEEGFKLNQSFRRPTPADLLQLDADIRAAFPPESLLTPDDVRGQHKTLWEAVSSDGWPALSKTAGKVFVILHETGPNRAAYLDGHPALEGRAMFVESDLGEPHAAVLVRNDPTQREIATLAQQGYLVRTRVDSQGRVQTAQREQGLASGAHILTTDYPPGEIEAERAFSLPNQAPARPNPITAPKELQATVIAEPIP